MLFADFSVHGPPCIFVFRNMHFYVSYKCNIILRPLNSEDHHKMTTVPIKALQKVVFTVEFLNNVISFKAVPSHYLVI